MRPTRYTSGLTALLALGGLAAGCGAAQQTPRAVRSPSAPIARLPTPVHIAFLAPAQGASVGSTVVARVKVSERGPVRFRLDGGRPRIAVGRAITYRRLAPGRHLLVAQLWAAGGQRATATATTHFRARRAHIRPVPTTTPPPAPPAPAAPSAAGSAATAPVAPPAPAPTVAPPAPRSGSSPKLQPGPGIPQGGGGDGDGDNSGGPSDGDGNV